MNFSNVPIIPQSQDRALPSMALHGADTSTSLSSLLDDGAKVNVNHQFLGTLGIISFPRTRTEASLAVWEVFLS